MKLKVDSLDRFQIVGFVISTLISISLIISNQDTVQSIILGLALAIITQLFDIQMRQSAIEERILEANKLSLKLYRDEKLFSRIHQIVNDYQMIKNDGWFNLFMARADAALADCHHVIHLLAEGSMAVPNRSPYNFAFAGILEASASLKGVTSDNLAWWRSERGKRYLENNAELVKRGVDFTRIFILPQSEIGDVIDILQEHRQAGVKVFVAFIEDVPHELNQNFIIMDDRLVTRLERIGQERARERNISTKFVEVEQAKKTYEILLQYVQPLEKFTQVVAA